MRFAKSLFIAGALAVASQAHAAAVTGGQTSVLLDLDTLSSVGLEFSGVGGPVIAPGNLGPDSVAFPVNSRDAAAPALPTTCSFRPSWQASCRTWISSVLISVMPS